MFGCIEDIFTTMRTFQDLLHSKKKWVGGGDGPSDFSVSTSPNWTFGIIIGSLGTGIGTRA